MGAQSRTHYQVLGIRRDATAHDVRRAYERMRAEMQEEAWAPDPRRVVQLQTAYEVLGDEARRAEYDRALRSGPLRDPRRRRAWIAAAATGAFVVAAAVVFMLRGAPRPSASRQEMLSAAALAVGRLSAVDIGGRTTPLGLAFAIATGRLAASCPATPPDAQLVVRIGSRDVPARLEPTPAGQPYCTLSAPQTASWPLAVASAAPAAGDPVFAARLDATGEAVLAEGRMARIERGARFAVLAVSGAAAAAQSGAPLLDAQGRVVAIGDARERYIGLFPTQAPNKDSRP